MEEQRRLPERLAEANSQNTHLLLMLQEKDKEVEELRQELEKKDQAHHRKVRYFCAQMKAQLLWDEGWATPEPGARSQEPGAPSRVTGARLLLLLLLLAGRTDAARFGEDLLARLRANRSRDLRAGPLLFRA